MTSSAQAAPRHWYLNPYLLLILTVLFWSGNWVVGRAVREHVPPIALSFWRWTIALALVLPLAWPHLRTQWPEIRKAWKPLTLLSLLGTGSYNAVAYVAVAHTTATNGVLLNAVTPVVIVLLAWAFLGRRLHTAEAMGMAISIAGVLAIIAHGEWARLAALTFNVGDLWALLSVLMWALYTLCLRWRPGAVHPYAFLAAVAAIGLVLMIPGYAWEYAAGGRIVLSPETVGGMLYAGIFPAFLGYIFWNRAVTEIGGSRAGMFMYLMPVFGALLSFVFLGERPQSFHFAGIILVFAGIYLTTRVRQR